MAEYMIQHVEGGYLYKTPKDHWGRTKNLNLVARFPYDKAVKILNNCIGSNMRKFWMIVPDASAVSIPCSDKETASEFDWQELSDTQHQLYKKLSKYSEELRARLSEVDLEICDIQHYIEFFTLDAAKGYKAYRMLKERLERRRTIKDEMSRVNCFLNGSSEDFSSGKIGRQINGVDHSRYTPRVLNELFGPGLMGETLPHVC